MAKVVLKDKRLRPLGSLKALGGDGAVGLLGVLSAKQMGAERIIVMSPFSCRITAAGMTKEVTFEPIDGPFNDRIDDAYRAKYHDSPYLGPMIGDRARSATVRVMPRDP